MATENQQHLKQENEKYAANFDKGGLPIPPAKKYLIGTSPFPQTAPPMPVAFWRRC